MATFYLDTSAAFKRYRVEEGTDVLDELFDRPGPDDHFTTSFLTVLEVSAATHRLMGAGQLSAARGREILAEFQHDLDEIFRIWPVDHEIIASAIQQAERHRLRSADAIHLATAIAVGVAIGGTVVMVSSDRELCLAAERVGMIALDPRSNDALALLRQLRSG